MSSYSASINLDEFSCDANSRSFLIDMLNAYVPEKNIRDAYIYRYDCSCDSTKCVTAAPNQTLPPGYDLSKPYLIYQPTGTSSPYQNTQENIIDFNTSSNTIASTFDFNKITDVFNFSKEFLINEFVNELKAIATDDKFCKTNTLISSTTNVNNNAILIGCVLNINIGQKIQPSESICMNINERLKYMNNDERNQLFDKAINKLKIKLLNESKLVNKTRFINLLSTLLKNNINTTPSNSTTSCSQDIKITKTQTINLEGIIRCNNGVFNFNNRAFVNPYMKCVVEPIWTNLENNNELRNLYNKGDNSNCIYSETQITACDKTKNKYNVKIDIIEPQIGIGSCDYFNGQIVEKDCTIPECEVSAWSNWSDCIPDTNNPRKGLQKRIRKYIKTGEGCQENNMIETKECELTREQTNIVTQYIENNQREQAKLNNIATSNGWITLYTQGSFDTAGKKVLIVSLFLIIFIVTFFILK